MLTCVNKFELRIIHIYYLHMRKKKICLEKCVSQNYRLHWSWKLIKLARNIIYQFNMKYINRHSAKVDWTLALCTKNKNKNIAMIDIFNWKYHRIDFRTHNGWKKSYEVAFKSIYFFEVFFGKFKAPKSHSEFNWPLACGQKHIFKIQILYEIKSNPIVIQL